MDVVSAGVHHAVIQGAVAAGAVLLQRQGVDIRPDAHHVAGLSAPDDAHDARVGTGLVLDAPLVQQGGDALLGLQLLGAQLGVLVQLPADGDHFIGNGFDFLLQFHKIRLL